MLVYGEGFRFHPSLEIALTVSPYRKMDRTNGSGMNVNPPVWGTEAQIRMAWEPSGRVFLVWRLRAT